MPKISLSRLAQREFMMRTDQARTTHSGALVLAVSLELAAAKWRVALHDGRREKPALHTVAQPQAGARLQAVLNVIEQQKQKWSLCCFEGFEEAAPEQS
jgi:transposase